VIDPARAEIDTLAQGMITTINDQHIAGITLDGNAGGHFFEPADLLGTPTPDAGSIRLAITNPRDIAVAFPVGISTNQTNTGTGQIDVTAVDSSDPAFDATSVLTGALSFTYDDINKEYTLTYQGETATIAYDPATESGKSIDLSTLTFTNILGPAPTSPVLTISLTGVPADTDQFAISNSVDALGNFSAVGDNRNALALSDLQISKILNGGTQSFGDAYGILVANVATRTHQADVSQRTQQGLLDQTSLRYESVSGVNLDEEAANLIKFQQAYQAASQIITVSNTVFNSLISAM